MALTKDHVTNIFTLLTDHATAPSFFSHVIDDVDWTVTGSAHPQACHFTSKQQVIEDMIKIGGLFEKPHQLSLVNVIVGQDGKTAVVELEGKDGKLKNGKDYKNQYLYIVGFNEQGDIVSTKGYMDTAMVRDAFEGSGLE